MHAFFLAVFIIGGAIVFGVAGVLILRKFTHPYIAEGHNDVLVPIF